MKLILKIFVWPVTLALDLLTWIGALALSRTAFLFGLASALITPVALLVLITTSVKNGVILLALAFLISPLGLPMLAARMIGGVASVNEAIKNIIHG